MIYELDDYNKNILLGYQGLKTKLVKIILILLSSKVNDFSQNHLPVKTYYLPKKSMALVCPNSVPLIRSH
jgi:hypothetical protein